MEIRTRKVWVYRDEKFWCSVCKAEGKLSDEKKSTDPFFWDEDAEKITCVKCGHQLTSKKELEEEVEIKETQEYGLYLRFVSERFNPCKVCQEAIHKQFKTHPYRLDYGYIKNQQIIDLLRGWKESGGRWTLRLRFLNSAEDIEFCKECSKRLDMTIYEAKELHIGNDVKPMVELWRKWEIVDEEDL